MVLSKISGRQVVRKDRQKNHVEKPILYQKHSSLRLESKMHPAEIFRILFIYLSNQIYKSINSQQFYFILLHNQQANNNSSTKN